MHTIPSSSSSAVGAVAAAAAAVVVREKVNKCKVLTRGKEPKKGFDKNLIGAIRSHAISTFGTVQ